MIRHLTAWEEGVGVPGGYLWIAGAAIPSTGL